MAEPVLVHACKCGICDATNAMQQAVELCAAMNRLSRLEFVLRSIADQCGNVIYNCEQSPSDNATHLRAWRQVESLARLSISKEK